MSLLDRVIGSVAQPATDSERREARSRMLDAASPSGDWLALVLRQHQQIEAAFQAVAASQEPVDRRVAFQELSRLSLGHSSAEESVLYPALARGGDRRHAEHAYSDQASLKMQLASLEQLAPLSHEFNERLEHMRQDTVQHFFEEEAHWFIELLRAATTEEHRILTQRFQQEFDRYVCSDELISVLEGIQVQQVPADSTI